MRVFGVTALLGLAMFGPLVSVSRASAPQLSPFFRDNCVTCHGANGDEGFAPPLSGLDYQSFLHSIRGGHPDKGVPAFDSTEYPDAVLTSDYTSLTNQAAD